MKKTTSKLIIGLAVGILLAGGIGVIAYGSDGFTNPDITTWFDGEWRAVKIEDQSKDYTGEKVEPDVVLPEGFTYEILKIEKDGEEVALETGAIEIGDYVFTIKVTKGEETRDYFCNLKIVEPQNNVETNVEAKNLSLKLLAVTLAEDGSIIKEFTYSILPEEATNKSINVSVAWADDNSSKSDDDSFKTSKSVQDYVTITKDESSKKITLTCKQAFGSQIIGTITSVDNPNAQASVKVEYRKRRTYDYEILGNTLSSGVNNLEELLDFTFTDGVGTLPFNGTAESVLKFEVGTLNSSVSTSFDNYVTLKNQLLTGESFAKVLAEVNKLDASSYNSVVSIMNSHKTDLVTRDFVYSNEDTGDISGTLVYGFELGSTTIKVENIEISDETIEF